MKTKRYCCFRVYGLRRCNHKVLRRGSCKRAAASALLHVRAGECAAVWLRGECKRAAENVRLLAEVLLH